MEKMKMVSWSQAKPKGDDEHDDAMVLKVMMVLVPQKNPTTLCVSACSGSGEEGLRFMEGVPGLRCGNFSWQESRKSWYFTETKIEKAQKKGFTSPGIAATGVTSSKNFSMP